MAKRNEFKPDKPRSGIWSKLYLTRLQRRAMLKWVLYALILVALSVLQDVILCRVRIFGATTDLIPAAIFCICVLEQLHRGSLFSLIASIVYLFSGSSLGPYTIVFITALAVLVTFFRQSYLQAGFSATALCVAAATVLYELATFCMGLFLGLTTPARIGAFFLTAVLSTAAVLALYPVFLAIGRIGGQQWKE